MLISFYRGEDEGIERLNTLSLSLSFLLICYNTDSRAWQATVHGVTKVLVMT